MSASTLAELYDYLALLPDTLYEAVVTSPTDDLPALVQGVLTWHEALVAGRTPFTGLAADTPPPEWPAPPVGAIVAQVLDKLGFPEFAKDQLAIVEELLLTVLQLHQEAPETLETLLQRQILADGPDDTATEEDNDDTRQRTHDEYARRVLQLLTKQWKDRIDRWRMLALIVGPGGDAHGLGAGDSKGQWSWHGLQQAMLIAKQLQYAPRLRDLIRRIGRVEDAEATANSTVMEQAFRATTETKKERREVPAPWAPQQIRGIERSDSITRMLPSEAVLLKRPALRMLWHARRAERALLAFKAEGTDFEMVDVSRVVQVPYLRPKPVERGPLLIAVDTSGSMSGHPETIAKAVVLEMVRVAHRENRRCYLYAFSGPGDVMETELSFAGDGMRRVMQFLGHSFDGGTDLDRPLLLIGRKLSEPAWQRADVVLVSDGFFSVPEEVHRNFHTARSSCGARMYGLCVGGSWETDAMHRICTEVHTFEQLR